MVKVRFFIVLLLAVDGILAAQENTTANAIKDIERKEKLGDTRRKRNRSHRARSTSSSSGSKDKKDSKDGNGSSDSESLNLSSDLNSSEDESRKRYAPKSSEERKGWRKWHRKCHPCPEEMSKKWRDPSIKWICGAYQRAQRSFKSLCMMHYRNCQDGTMFVKIHDHRCKEDSERVGMPHGLHFFYDYKVHITGESTRSSSESKTIETHSARTTEEVE